MFRQHTVHCNHHSIQAIDPAVMWHINGAIRRTTAWLNYPLICNDVD